MSWLRDLFGVDKPIIAMCHLIALPGDPGYESEGGMSSVVEHARVDMLALQEGGVDAILFSNEGSLPYLTKVDTVTVAAMARVIGELLDEIQVPFGVNVLWDPMASLDLAMATGAVFVREVFTGVYASDFGLWDTHCGKVIRHQHAIGAQGVHLLFNIVPEAAAYLSRRDIGEIARSTVFNMRPDALCVSGLTAGVETSTDTLRVVKEAVPDIPVFANTGVHVENIEEQLSISDGAIIGTAFKRDCDIWNPVDPERVLLLIDQVKTLRSRIKGEGSN
jgi:membrane complex biogenesis BtpA family protein